MPEDNLTPVTAPLSPPMTPLTAPAPGGLGRVLAAMAIAFALGFALAVWAGWQSGFDWSRLLPGHTATPLTPTAPELGLDAHVAALESRLDALDHRADAAAGQAGRAEALLIAFATRRAVERGAPLGYLETQLKLRFGDALPNAVTVIATGARNPVTLDQLALGLDSLAAQLASSGGETGWERMRRELSGLFVIHNSQATGPADPARQLAQARLLLREGRTADAIATVRALPLTAKDQWIAGATRYQDLQRALDLLETTALVEPRELNDSTGNKVVVPPAPGETPVPVPSQPVG